MNARGRHEATPGGRLRGLAEAAGLTQTALADGLGIDQTVVSRLYSGKVSMTIPVAERAAQLLGTTPEWLLFGDRAGDEAIRAAREEGRRSGLLTAMAILQELTGTPPPTQGEVDPMAQIVRLRTMAQELEDRTNAGASRSRRRRG